MQLQFLDLALAIRSGLTPSTLTADWDARLPLNIEDDDISASMTEFPKERKGLTGISYCLFTFSVLHQQRNFFLSNNRRFEFSWQSNESVPNASKDTLIDQLEENVNKNFLQYCDPLKPLDTLIQLVSRALICGMRMRKLHTLACSKHLGQVSQEQRSALLEVCMQCLEYNVAMSSQPSIKHFQWLTQGFVPWHACKHTNWFRSS